VSKENGLTTDSNQQRNSPYA